MQWCDCVVSLLLSMLANLNTDSGLQHWAINSYTTTGHNLPQSHLPTKQDAYITTWVVPAAKTRAQSAPATSSLLHTKHTSLSHPIDCYSAVQGRMEINNDGYQMLSSDIFAVVSFHTLVSLPRMKQLPDLLWSLGMVGLRIPMRRHREPKPYMCMKERCYESNNKAQGPAIRSRCLFKIRVENREIHTPKSSRKKNFFASIFQAQGSSLACHFWKKYQQSTWLTHVTCHVDWKLSLVK